MVTKEFVETTDKIIQALKDQNITAGNGNVVISKPKVTEKIGSGILHAAKQTMTIEKNRAGFARILAIPNNLRPDEGDLDLKVGDYVFYVFTDNSPIASKPLSAVLRIALDDSDGEPPVQVVGDAQVILHVPASSIEVV